MEFKILAYLHVSFIAYYLLLFLYKHKKARDWTVH